MPLKTKKRGDKWRIIEPNGKIARRKDGSPVDKGGAKTRQTVIRRMTPINIAYARKKGHKIPRK